MEMVLENFFIEVEVEYSSDVEEFHGLSEIIQTYEIKVMAGGHDITDAFSFEELAELEQKYRDGQGE